MNLPNKLTTLRMIMVIPFLILGILFIKADGQLSFTVLNMKTIYLTITVAIFALAMITDWLDGYIARKNNSVTSYGKLFDPLADKLMTTSAFIILAVAQLVPIWVVVPMVLRDIVVDGCRNLLVKNNQEVAASFAGKAKTMMQSTGIVIVFLIAPSIELNVVPFGQISWELACINIPLYIALILSMYSGANYVKKTVPFINMK